MNERQGVCVQSQGVGNASGQESESHPIQITPLSCQLTLPTPTPVCSVKVMGLPASVPSPTGSTAGLGAVATRALLLPLTPPGAVPTTLLLLPPPMLLMPMP